MSKEDSDLLYEVFISGRDQRVNIPALATASGMAERTVYEYATDDRKTVPVQVWRGAFEVSADIRFRRKLEPRGHELTPLLCRPPRHDIEAECLDLIGAVSKLVQDKRQALAAGHLRVRAATCLLQDMDDIMAEVQVLRADLRELVDGGSAPGLRAVGQR